MRARSIVVMLVVIIAGAAPASAPLARATGLPTYRLVDLGTLESGTASFGLGLNEHGLVAGTSRTGPGSRPQLAFLWDRGSFTNLGTLPGSTFSRAFTVNDRGVAVGEAFTAVPEISRAVMWTNGELVDLGTLGGAGAVANGINKRGLVVGASSTSAGVTRAFVWEDGSLTDLGALSEATTATSRANRISNEGAIVGTAQTDELYDWGGRVSHAYIAFPTKRGYELHDLGALGGERSFSTAHGLNERKMVVGESLAGLTPTGSEIYRAFFWHKETMVELPGLENLRHSRANDVNKRGEVVGHATGFQGFPTIDGRALLWSDGSAIDLNGRIPAGSGWILRSAEAINDDGQIVGYGTVAGQTRAFLLEPR